MPSSISTLLCVLTALSCAYACKSSEPAPLSDQATTRQQDHMSTYVTITVAAPEAPEVLAAIDAAFAEIARLEALLSEWQPASDISKVNAAAGRQHITVSQELFDVLAAARDVSEASGGAFDATFAAFSGLWDFKSLRPEIPPKRERLARAGLVDYAQVTLDSQMRTVKLERQGMQLGLGGIAKGYAVDSASQVLQEKGYPNHLIVAGGDLVASGRKKSRRWNIGVRSPSGHGLYATLEIEDEGVATSGDYEHYFVDGGVRYHHILDPKTGLPARGSSSATVVAPNATLADAFATAMFVLGPEKGRALAMSRPDLETLIFDDVKHAPHATRGLDARLVILPPEEAAALAAP